MHSSLLLQGATVVSSDLETRDDVLVRNGLVEEIDRFVEEYDDVRDVSGMLLLPGLIDCHVHLREPGLTHKATMRSEAAAAVAAGYTTLCDMPNTIPPTVTVAALADKVRRASDIAECDIRFFLGITQPAHAAMLRELFSSSAAEAVALRSRCCGVKIFLDHSTGDQKIDHDVVDEAFAACAAHGIVLVAHCEDPEQNARAAAQNERTHIAAHSQMRPALSEQTSVENAIALARTHGTRFHVAHASTEGAIDAVHKAKQEGLPVTCEVTPHHLFLTTDDYETLGPFAKMNPPLRSHKHRIALWQGIADGTVDCIATDHAPHTKEEKTSVAPLDAPSGVPGIETVLPLLLSVAAGHWPHPQQSQATCPQFSYKDIVRLCHTNPSRIFSLHKQEIEEDKVTDIVIVDPAAEWTIEASAMKGACTWTPFDGWQVRGRAVETLLAPREQH